MPLTSHFNIKICSFYRFSHLGSFSWHLKVTILVFQWLLQCFVIKRWLQEWNVLVVSFWAVLISCFLRLLMILIVEKFVLESFLVKWGCRLNCIDMRIDGLIVIVGLMLSGIWSFSLWELFYRNYLTSILLMRRVSLGPWKYGWLEKWKLFIEVSLWIREH